MKQIKIILGLGFLGLLSSCNLDINLGQVSGNGNVQTEERKVTEEFNSVRASAGMGVYLIKGTENKIVVEADENLLEIIETSVTNGELKIRAEKNIGKAKAKKVYVTYISLSSITANSGADIIADSIIESETLSLSSSSGADMELEVLAKDLFIETSSGADIDVSGKAISLRAEASSGSDLNARKLLVSTCRARASSGADVIVNVQDKLNARASSGGDVRYYGDPSDVSKNGGPSGNVRKMQTTN